MKMVLSLQSLCEVRIAVDICNNSEAKEVIFRIPKDIFRNSSVDHNTRKRENFFKHLITEISKLIKHFPGYLLKNIQSYIPLVAVEMLQWAKFHEDKFGITFYFSKNFLSSSFFTTKGVIDCERSARELMKETSLKPRTLFNIACFFSFPDFMLQYWIKIQDTPTCFEILFKKEIPTDYFSFNEFNSKLDYEDIIKLWECELERKYMQSLSTKDSNYFLHALKSSVESGSEVSVRYFWKQLNETDKNSAADFIAQIYFNKEKLFIFLERNCFFFFFREPYVNMIIFLYNELDNEKIKEIIGKYKLTYLVLRNMLRWPYQSLFLNMAKNLLDILLEYDFFRLLLDIINKIGDQFVTKTFNYRFLFKMLWIESPEQYKMDLFRRVETNRPPMNFPFDIWKYKDVTRFHHLISQYSILDCTYEDRENIRLILESASEAELEGILLKESQVICIEMVKNGNLSFADLYLSCLDVKDVEIFKRNLLTHSQFYAIFKELLDDFKLNSIDIILKWILSLKGVENFKESLSKLLLQNPSLKFDVEVVEVSVSDYGPSETLLVNVEPFLWSFKDWLRVKKFDKANAFLQYVFSSESEVADYKRKLTSYAFSCPENDSLQRR